MSLPEKFLRAVMLEWGGKSYALGGVLNPAYQILDGSFTVKRERRPVKIEHFTSSLLELRQNSQPKQIDGMNYNWAIIHWLGTPSNPFENSCAALFLPPEADLSFAESRFDKALRDWKAKGWIVSEKELTRLACKTVAPKPSPEVFEAQRLSKARLAVLKQSFPETVSNMEKKRSSGLAFQYESIAPKTADKVHEALAINWPEWQHFTAKELSLAVKRCTGEEIAPRTLEKLRERLGLLTKRPTGPRQKT